MTLCTQWCEFTTDSDYELPRSVQDVAVKMFLKMEDSHDIDDLDSLV